MSDDRNRLVDETSPYLKQHADNPVDWYPWGEEALERARRENRPIFLSVGYSACHWCHVMEDESFEDEEIAELLNDYFVNIKVDREERPEIDRIYMDAVQLMTGQGGWPMSVWLTPDLEPFYAGTYFPPRGKWGRPGFVDVVEEVHRAWTEERDRVDEIAGEMTERLEQMADTAESADSLGREPIRAAADELSRRFDPDNGGFGTEPKFPASMQCRLLFRVATDDEFSDEERARAVEMAEKTLVRMASGGMYDHLGGGFHRYSTDAEWLIPHFEKMLYDNALLLNAYREAHEVTGRSFYRQIVEEVGDYVLREMVDEGETDAFYATQDADSEGEEGKFFVWTLDELQDVLGEERGERAAAYWGVTETGNFEEGKSVLHRLGAVDLDERDVPSGHREDDIEAMRRELLEARKERVRPARDEKIIASWNGLMIEGLALAGRTLGRDDYVEAAVDAADFILDEMCADGRAQGLQRIHKDGRTRFGGCLDDYANMAVAALTLYEVTGRPRWLDDARRLVDELSEQFARPEGGFYYAAEDQSDLLVRQTELHDRALPSASSRALEALYRLAVWTGDAGYEDELEEGLSAFYANMLEQAPAMTQMVSVLDAQQSGPLEVVCVRGGDAEESLEEVVDTTYLRHGLSVAVDDADGEQQPPVVADKEAVDGSTTVYVCRRGQCRAPATTREALQEQLDDLFAGIPE